MSPLLLVRLALQSIRRNTGRSALTMLGVIIGVGSVVVMVAIGLGAQAEVQQRIANLGTNMVVVTPGSSSRGGVRGGAGSFNRLKVEDAMLLRRDAQSLAAVTPVIFTRTRIRTGGANWRTTIYGVDTTYQQIRDWPVDEGRWFEAEEVRARRKVALVGQTVVSQVFDGENPVGSRIELRGVPVEIIGTLTAKGQTAEGSDQDDVVLAPYTTVQTRLAGHQFIAQILASAWSEEELPQALAEVQTLMREAHGLAEWEEDDFEARDQSQLAETARSTTEVMTVLLSAIASISLLVGGIGIMNIMLVSVAERTREIGIRRALGARRRDVLAQFLVESVVLASLGGLIGAALGILAAALVARVTGWVVTVDPRALGVAVGFSLGVGAFFGWYPARRAARLDVIDALRHQ